jgi:hypothetical protein
LLKEDLTMKRYLCFAVALVILSSAKTWAQPTIDGTADVGYGAALSTQNTRTGFGDGPVGGNPDPIITGTNFATGGGSELDQVFATVSNGRLYVTIAGNLEENFNKLDVFIDSKSGGVNQLDGAALPGGLDSFCCGGFTGPRGNNATNVGALQRMSGMKFDTGFDADYALIFTHGRESVGSPGDYNNDGGINAADYTRWRDNLGKTVADATNPTNPTGQMFNLAPGNGTIDQGEYDVWKTNFSTHGKSEFWAVTAHYADLTQGAAGQAGALGMQLAPRGEPRVLRPDGANALGDYAFVPQGNPGNTNDLISDYTLTGLSQGELIDRDYALGPGGCTDDGGAGCAAREFEFALDVDPTEIGTVSPNTSNHRNFNNFVDLQMALDNSNVGGVRGSGGPFDLVEGEDNPQDVRSGIEFSIPLSAIGNPTGNIRVTAMINGGNHDFLANQVAGEGIVNYDGPGTGGNLGNLLFGASPLGSFDDIPGNQFVTVANPGLGGAAVAGVPEPSSLLMALATLAISVVATRRRI